MSVVHDAWMLGIKPDPKIDVAQWSNEYRFLARQGAAEYGKYDMERMPYLEDIALKLSPQHIAQEIFACKGVQLGLTELGNNVCFTYADLYPCPILAVFPTRDLTKKHLESKFWPGVSVTPKIAEKIEPRKQGAMESSSTTFAKFPGGYIAWVWSESKSSFASGSYRVVWFSDVDRFPDDVEGEGDSIALGSNRADSFGPMRKIFGESSPTKKRSSKIYAEAINGPQNRYFMKCPHCGGYVDFQKDFFVYEEKDYQLIGDVKFSCKHNGCLIEEWQKFEMMKKKNGAQWMPTNLNWNNPLRETYFIGAYYSPFKTWNEIFQNYLSALADKKNKGKSHKLKVWTNTYDGTLFEDEEDALSSVDVEIEDMMNRREDYKLIPDNVVLLSAGIDTQGNRFEVAIIGWVNSREKYLISHYVITGDPASFETQRKLDQLLFRTFFDVEGGGKMKIFCSSIDTGGNKTNHIYEYVRKRPKYSLYAIKGGKSLDDPIVKDTGSIVSTKKTKNLNFIFSVLIVLKTRYMRI